jgi:hypothetical protein
MEPGDEVEVHDGVERVRSEGPTHGRCVLEASQTGGGSLGKKIPHTFSSESRKGPLGFHTPISFSPQIHPIEAACGFPWAASDCWGGTISGDRHSFVQVLKQKQAPMIIVLPRGSCGWR